MGTFVSIHAQHAYNHTQIQSAHVFPFGRSKIIYIRIACSWVVRTEMVIPVSETREIYSILEN